MPRADTRSVGVTEPSGDSLYKLSFPEMNGVPKPFGEVVASAACLQKASHPVRLLWASPRKIVK